MNRLPTLLLLVGLIGAMIWVDRTGDDASDAATQDLGVVVGPRVPGEGSLGSTWYCAGGFTTPDALNDHRVILTNPTEEPARGSLTLYPSLIDVEGNPRPFQPAVQPIELAGNEQSVISLAPIVASLDADLATPTGSFVGALVEFDSGSAIVEHAVVTPLGQDLAVCATEASTSWWFASGTTTADVTYQVHLLNPFPDDAVVDLVFLTDGGARTPSIFTGRLVPAQSLTVLDLSPSFAPWDQVAAEVTTRTGRVIVERIQVFRNQAGPVGLSLTPGTSALSDQWFFPAGSGAPGASESFVIYNPNDEAAEVEFELKPDSADRAGDNAPLGVPLGPNERWVVNVSRHPSHPVSTVATIDATEAAVRGERFFVSIRSFNGVPVLAERVWSRPLEVGLGVASSFGITAASTDQTLAVPPWFEPGAIDDVSTGRQGELAVLNPAGDTISRVEVWVGGPGGEVLRERAELAPRRRAAFDLNTLLREDDTWIRVVSSTGTMAEIVVAPTDTIATAAAIPGVGTTSIPNLLSFD
ncbi:MAG: DUF5719 family protein [Actinomycetota bacterium]